MQLHNKWYSVHFVSGRSHQAQFRLISKAMLVLLVMALLALGPISAKVSQPDEELGKEIGEEYEEDAIESQGSNLDDKEKQNAGSVGVAPNRRKSSANAKSNSPVQQDGNDEDVEPQDEEKNMDENDDEVKNVPLRPKKGSKKGKPKGSKQIGNHDHVKGSFKDKPSKPDEENNIDGNEGEDKNVPFTRRKVSKKGKPKGSKLDGNAEVVDPQDKGKNMDENGVEDKNVPHRPKKVSKKGKPKGSKLNGNHDHEKGSFKDKPSKPDELPASKEEHEPESSSSVPNVNATQVQNESTPETASQELPQLTPIEMQPNASFVPTLNNLTANSTAKLEDDNATTLQNHYTMSSEPGFELSLFAIIGLALGAVIVGGLLVYGICIITGLIRIKNKLQEKRDKDKLRNRQRRERRNQTVGKAATEQAETTIPRDSSSSVAPHSSSMSESESKAKRKSKHRPNKSKSKSKSRSKKQATESDSKTVSATGTGKENGSEQADNSKLNENKFNGQKSTIEDKSNSSNSSKDGPSDSSNGSSA